MPTLYILRGIPASGKSTFRENLGLAYVNRDTLRLENPDVSEKQITQLQEDKIRNNLQAGMDFILDNTHIRERSYSKYAEQAKQHGYEVIVKEFRTSLYECLNRNKQRSRIVPFSIILKMAHDIGWYEEELKQYFNAKYNKQKAIIVDLDGTLCDITHRRHYVLEKPKNWKAFFAGIRGDKVTKAVEDIIKSYYTLGDKVILVSGRPETYRDVTENWLKKHGIPYHWLLMRGFNDKRDDTEVKEEIYDRYIAPYFTVLFSVDDRKRVCRMWYRKGIPLFMVGDPDAEEF